MKIAFTYSKFVAVTLAFLLVAAVLSVNCFGQTESGQISGAVTDASGALVSGAKVTVKSVNTGFTRSTTSNSSGLYTVSTLKPDTYDVTVEATGFQKYTRRVQVAVSSQNEISAQLVVGATSVTVEVSGVPEAVAVNTETQTLSTIVTAQQLNALPTDPTRNAYALVGSSAGVTEDNNSTNRGAGYSINGQRTASTSILLDGAENVDLFTAGIGQKIPLDSVQEFSVLTSNFTAEYGRASGGVVNLVTKSGTNAFHGSAYEFNRISGLSSNTYQNDADRAGAFQDGTCVAGQPCSIGTKGVFTRNNFGFSLGGPVKKDKLFFFNNAEWIRVRSAAPQKLAIIDPASYSLLAPASQAFFSQYGKLAPGVQTISTQPCNTTTALTCDVVSVAVPSDAGGGSPQNTWQEVARVDFNLSDRTTLTGRYAAYHEIDFPGTVNFSAYDGYSTGQNQFDQNYTFSINHTFSSSIVNTAKVVYNRLNGPVQPLGSAPIGPTLYTAGALQVINNAPLVFPGYSETTPGNSIPFGGPQNLYQFYDDLSINKGKHQFKFGFQFIHIRDNRQFGAYENAVEILGTTLDSGLNNLVSGQIRQFQGAVSPQGEFPCVKDPVLGGHAATGGLIVTPECTLNLPVGPPAFNRNFHYNDYAAYGQDSWKLTPRFTVNLGLRWEYYGVQHNANTALDSNFVMGPGSNIFDQIRNGSVKLAKDGGVFWKPYYHAFGPRVGFAWDVFGDGKTSLRGGFSMGYERNFGNVTFNAIQNPPAYAVVSLINRSVNKGGSGDIDTMPVFSDNAGPLAGTGTKALPAVSQRAINQNMKPAYAETWNLAIERQVTRNSLLSLNYSGTHDVHLYDIANVNPSTGGGVYLGDGTAAGDATFNPNNRLNTQYSNMNFRSDGGYSHYNALNAQWRANNLLNKGVSLSAVYTWSHSLDNLSSTFTETNGGNSGLYYLGYLDAFNPKLGYGNSDFDIRHRFVLTGSWEVPWMKSGGNGIARAVLGGWGMGGTFNVRSGAPFSIYDCSNSNDTSCPLYVPPTGIAHTGSSTNQVGNVFDYIALPSTAGVTDGLGDSLGVPVCTGLLHTGCTYTTTGQPFPGRNDFYGPRFWNIDMNFFKNIKLTERFQMQFRAEMYNIFNHNNFYVNGLNLDTTATTVVQTEKGGPWGYTGTTADERRNIQLGLKLIF